MARIVIDDRVDRLWLGNVRVDAIKETDELLMPMALHVVANNGAVEHVERGEQRGGAVAFVVVGHRPCATWLHRKARLSWPALHEVVRDPSRNFLFNHLGLNEDAKIYLRPDCADLPYTLRAYFAYKMGLPYGFSKCSRGSGGKAPTCPQWFSLQNAEEAKPPPPAPVAAPIPPTVSGYFGSSSAPAPPASKRTGPAPSFAELVQIVWDSVHSGSGRTALADNNTDYYPVPLSADTLRPGTVYADPYGHILMIVRRIAQTEDAAGIILAVDGQPDGGRNEKLNAVAYRLGRMIARGWLETGLRPGRPSAMFSSGK